ncbi:hypothetical protein OKW41_002736 [Paraburkholderia sp. UCT70]
MPGLQRKSISIPRGSQIGLPISYQNEASRQTLSEPGSPASSAEASWLGPHVAASLVGQDGVIIMRPPCDPRIIGREISRADTFRQFRAATRAASPTPGLDPVSFKRRISIVECLCRLDVIFMTS